MKEKNEFEKTIILLSDVLKYCEECELYVGYYAKYKNLFLINYYMDALEQVLVSFRGEFKNLSSGILYTKEFRDCIKKVKNMRLENIELDGVFESINSIDFFLDIIEVYAETTFAKIVNENKKRYVPLINNADVVNIYEAYIKNTGKRVYLINLVFKKFKVNKKQYNCMNYVKVNILLDNEEEVEL